MAGCSWSEHVLCLGSVEAPRKEEKGRGCIQQQDEEDWGVVDLC